MSGEMCWRGCSLGEIQGNWLCVISESIEAVVSGDPEYPNGTDLVVSRWRRLTAPSLVPKGKPELRAEETFGWMSVRCGSWW